jgi:hypothetical protein
MTAVFTKLNMLALKNWAQNFLSILGSPFQIVVLTCHLLGLVGLFDNPILIELYHPSLLLTHLQLKLALLSWSC